jgi:CheY-like chemotaxis protein
MRALGGDLRGLASFHGSGSVAARFAGRRGWSKAAAAAKLVAMHPAIDAQPRGRVLTVDDSPVMRVLVAASLEALGYSVEAVDSGQAALAATLREDFDAVILDVDMPGIDGLAVGRALRKNPKTSASMIAMHTSLEEAFVRSGFDAYDIFLPKPCDARWLGERVDRMIRGQRQRGVA